jgi:hypothetical protein
MCSLDEEELSCKSAGKEKTYAEVDRCFTEATGVNTDTRDGDSCYEESDRNNVAGVDEKSYPRDMTDALPADFFDPAPW